MLKSEGGVVGMSVRCKGNRGGLFLRVQVDGNALYE